MNTVVATRQNSSPDLVLGKAVLSVAGRLGMNAKGLAAIIGCSEASVSRLKHGRGINPQSKEGELALLLIRLYRSLNAILGGNDEQSEQWFKAQNHHFDAIPQKKVNTVQGLIEVVQYLDAIRGKI